MALAAGTRLGSYEILDALGTGGMGEVYRARDTRLKRTVAIKVLPDAFTRDPDRLPRFEREAELLATLNHVNIAAIYGLEESSGVRALVLELIEGPTLADRIGQGPVPLEEALSIARQVAQGLEAAHARGIIHRDLKPANIKLRPDGTVKILDFGLAKVFDGTPLSDDPTQSPTRLSPTPTVPGVILGTAAYMSPEQARGLAVDKRTDVWAFGCVLFEMLAGRRPFDGDTLTDVVAAVLKSEPDWRALPAGTPASVRSLIARCLRKDPARRLHDIADGRLQIEEPDDPAGSGKAAGSVGTIRERAAWVAAAVSVAAALFFALRPPRSPSSGDPVTFAVFPPAQTVFSEAITRTVSVPSFALSPDGRALAFCAEAPGAKPTLWLRPIDRVDARQFPGTDHAHDPFWSPDGRWIAFFADGKLKKIAAAGGPVQVIAETISDLRGAAWSPEGTILIGAGRGPLLFVHSEGGRVAPVTTIDQSREEGRHHSPHFLPDGRHFLYTIRGRQQDRNGVYVGSLDGTTKKLLIRRNTTAVYVPPGYLLFSDENTLLGQAFDLERLEVNGQPFLVAEHAGRDTGFVSGVSASRTGTIAYAGIIARNGRLTWIDREGNVLAPTGTADGDYADFRLSPDDSRLAASLFDVKTNAVEIWVTDLDRRSTSRWAGGLVTASAIWSPDGTRLMFRSNRSGIMEFFERSAAGGGTDQSVLPREAYRDVTLNLVLNDWSPDGRHVLFTTPTPESSDDLWLFSPGKPETPTKFIASAGEQMHGNFSPDGRLVAYTSNESGRFEVYVETIPRSERKWPVSASGGYEPRWRADGREIYYLSEDHKLMAVSVGAGRSFGVPKPLFQARVHDAVISSRTRYVPSRDGKRFLVNTALDAPPSAINVIVHWAARQP